MTLNQWQKLMQSCEFTDNTETYNALLVAYTHKTRHYHSSKHIDACLHHLDKVRYLTLYPSEVELALWFHDAIYVARKSNNELESANWAKAFLVKNSAESEVIERVFNLVMATLHCAPTRTLDESLLVDIDLSILGSAEEIYNEFETAIRLEYKWVPYFLYKRKRIELLQGFLNRERIYTHNYFYDALEVQARMNIKRSIAML